MSYESYEKQILPVRVHQGAGQLNEIIVKRSIPAGTFIGSKTMQNSFLKTKRRWYVIDMTARKFLLFAYLFSAFSASATIPALETNICAPDDVALGGYDLVSYYINPMPTFGQPTISSEHNGLQYRFTSLQNRDAFLENPEKYLPNYLGWCSTNLSMGRLACPDYTNFKIENEKLLLFERVGFTNGLDVWNSDPALHRRQADHNFRRFSTPQ